MIENYKKEWNFLIKSFVNKRLSHFLIFGGASNPAKLLIATEFAKYVHCKNPNNFPCNECFPCYQIDKKIYPDVIFIEPEKKARQIISIQEIKKLRERVAYSSLSGKKRIVIIDRAQYLTLDSQNALLKTLEEPRGDILFILITDTFQTLLPTILSRAQILKFAFPKTFSLDKERALFAQAIENLKKEPLVKRFEFAKEVAQEKKVYQFLESYLYYLRNKLLELLNSDQRSQISSIKKQLFRLQELLHLLEISNINQKLAMEIFLMEL